MIKFTIISKNSSIETTITHIRPRFKIEVAHSQKYLLEVIKKLLSQNKHQLKGRIIGDNVILDIADDNVHYWSPQLNFRVEKSEDDSRKTVLSGLIGPRPPVWTLFMFIYFGVGIIGFLITSIGVSNYMLGEYSHSIWGLPIAILFMLTAYKAGKYGEKLGEDQIEILKQFIRDAIAADKKID